MDAIPAISVPELQPSIAKCHFELVDTRTTNIHPGQLSGGEIYRLTKLVPYMSVYRRAVVVC